MSNNAPVATPSLAEAAMMAELERLRAENDALKAGNKSGGARAPMLKVSEKGALSVYNLGRFPVTLYRSQWEALFAIADEIRAFIAANADKLKSKE